MGFDAVWFVEHHFLTTFSASPLSRGHLRSALPPDQAHPPGLRRGDTALPPPGSRRRAYCDGRPPVPRPRRVRHRPLGTLRAAGHGHRPAGYPRNVGGVPHHDPKIWESDYFEWRASSGRCRRARCCPSRIRSRTRRSGWRPCSRPPTSWRRRSASMALESTLPRCWSLPSASTRPQSRKRTRWALSPTTSGCPPASACAARMTRPPRNCPPSRSRPSSVQDVLCAGPEGHLLPSAGPVGGVPDHLAPNFSRYVDVPTQGGNGGSALDLSGGTALAQKWVEGFDAGTMAERGIIVAGDRSPASRPPAARGHRRGPAPVPDGHGDHRPREGHGVIEMSESM